MLCSFIYCPLGCRLSALLKKDLIVVFLLLPDSSASEFYVPTFRNTLSVPSSEIVHTTNEDGTDIVFPNVVA